MFIVMNKMSKRNIISSAQNCRVAEAFVIGYEPADLTVHPPPQNDREWVHFFLMGV